MHRRGVNLILRDFHNNLIQNPEERRQRLNSNGGYTTNPEKIYPQVGENVYWQREVQQVFIFSEKTGVSMAGNLTAGRIIELSDGTRSAKEIGKVLMTEFVGSPPEKEMLAFVNEFLSECEKKGFMNLRSQPLETEYHQELEESTSANVKKLIEENAILIVDEKASFESTEDDILMTYCAKEGKYLVFTEEEKDILIVILEEKPLQEVLADISERYRSQAKQVLTEFARELLIHGLARVQQENRRGENIHESSI